MVGKGGGRLSSGPCSSASEQGTHLAGCHRKGAGALGIQIKHSFRQAALRERLSQSRKRRIGHVAARNLCQEGAQQRALAVVQRGARARAWG